MRWLHTLILMLVATTALAQPKVDTPVPFHVVCLERSAIEQFVDEFVTGAQPSDIIGRMTARGEKCFKVPLERLNLNTFLGHQFVLLRLGGGVEFGYYPVIQNQTGQRGYLFARRYWSSFI